ncbi:hypothetical protein [Sinorhizobium psoraleae]|uniref:hypothetical protein n=1 Tax=Sinorhizobium psoraleae TaxID=520838 RepID=UPI0022B07774|nr:hypothetical protein [Sinorhizobium psoraleae]
MLPDTLIPNEFGMTFYGASEKPVFFGHYKLNGQPELNARNALCLDYPLQPCAYRWNGEPELKKENLILIPTPASA